MNCLACGAGNDAQVIFCVRCGAQLRPAPPPESWRYSGDLNRTQVDEPRRPPQPTPPPPPPPFAPGPQQQRPPQPHNVHNAHNAPRPTAPLYIPPTPPAPFAPTLTPPPAAASNATGGSQLAQVGMTLSVVVACLMLVGLIPCLGWLNWFTIIGAKAALIICIVGVATEKDPARKSKAMMGLIISVVAFGIILFRLLLSLLFGGGCV